jgi:hypothetical protein
MQRRRRRRKITGGIRERVGHERPATTLDTARVLDKDIE